MKTKVGIKILPILGFMTAIGILVSLLVLGLHQTQNQLKKDFLEEHELSEGMTVTVKGMNSSEEIVWWQDEEEDTDGVGYFFLPSYVSSDAIEINCNYVEKVIMESDNGTQFVLSAGKNEVPVQIGTIYKTTFIDEAGQAADSKEIAFLHSAYLPALYVNTESGSLEYLNEDKNNKETGDMALYDAEGILRYKDKLKSVSGRGNQTWDCEKKSYGIKLRHAANLLEMGKARNWVLLSNVYDESYIRNKITYEMARNAGMEETAELQYIDLYFNGVYAGMYMLCEKVELAKGRIDITSLEEKNEEVNGKNLEEAEDYLSEDGTRKGKLLTNNPEDITGGYLIEHDYGEKYGAEVSGFVTENNDKYVIKNPKCASKEEVDYIADLFQQMETAVLSDDGYNHETGKYFTEYIDLESFAKKYIVEEISKNDGGGTTSAFFYKKPDREDTLIYCGPVWDYDKAYGRVKNLDADPYSLGYETLHDSGTDFYYFLYQKPEFQEAVRKYYKECFSDYLEELQNGGIDSIVNEIRFSAILDGVRWKSMRSDDFVAYQDTNYEAVAAYIKGFISDRKEFLDDVWIRNKEIVDVHIVNNIENAEYYFGIIKGTGLPAMPHSSIHDYHFEGWFIEDSDEIYTENTPIVEDTTIVGRWVEKEES